MNAKNRFLRYRISFSFQRQILTVTKVEILFFFDLTRFGTTYVSETRLSTLNLTIVFFLSLSLYRALRSGDENPGIFPRPYVEKGASSCSHRKIGGECRRGCCLQDGGEGEFIIIL